MATRRCSAAKPQPESAGGTTSASSVVWPGRSRALQEIRPGSRGFRNTAAQGVLPASAWVDSALMGAMETLPERRSVSVRLSVHFDAIREDFSWPQRGTKIVSVSGYDWGCADGRAGDPVVAIGSFGAFLRLSLHFFRLRRSRTRHFCCKDLFGSGFACGLAARRLLVAP